MYACKNTATLRKLLPCLSGWFRNVKLKSRQIVFIKLHGIAVLHFHPITFCTYLIQVQRIIYQNMGNEQSRKKYFPNEGYLSKSEESDGWEGNTNHRNRNRSETETEDEDEDENQDEIESVMNSSPSPSASQQA